MADDTAKREEVKAESPVFTADEVQDDSDERSAAVRGRLETVLTEYGLSKFSRTMTSQWLLKVIASPSFARAGAWLMAQMNRRRIEAGHPGQVGCPEIIPGLTARPLWTANLFAWADGLTAAYPAIREEVLSLRGRGGFQPYRAPTWGSGPGALPAADGLGSSGTDSGDWNVYYLYLHNADYAANRERCPVTVAALANIPGAYSHAFISAMAPNTHITPHHGPTNKKLRVHLPIIVPKSDKTDTPCRLRVHDCVHAWREGEVMVFDDSFEHEAFNDADSPRIVLICDIWHPDLTAEEVKFFTLLQSAKLRLAKQGGELLSEEDNYYAILERAAALVPDDKLIFGSSES